MDLLTTKLLAEERRIATTRPSFQQKKPFILAVEELNREEEETSEVEIEEVLTISPKVMKGDGEKEVSVTTIGAQRIQMKSVETETIPT